MKTCTHCLTENEDQQPTCTNCGEAGWKELWAQPKDPVPEHTDREPPPPDPTPPNPKADPTLPQPSTGGGAPAEHPSYDGRVDGVSYASREHSKDGDPPPRNFHEGVKSQEPYVQNHPDAHFKVQTHEKMGGSEQLNPNLQAQSNAPVGSKPGHEAADKVVDATGTAKQAVKNALDEVGIPQTVPNTGKADDLHGRVIDGTTPRGVGEELPRFGAVDNERLPQAAAFEKAYAESPKKDGGMTEPQDLKAKRLQSQPPKKGK